MKKNTVLCDLRMGFIIYLSLEGLVQVRTPTR